MFKLINTLILFFFLNTLFSQNSLIYVDEENKDIGIQENIYKIKTDYIVKNNQSKTLYLLRADASKGLIVKASKKTIIPGDTSLIIVEYTPKHSGKFNETISLITSADANPFIISLSGNIKSIKTDDKTACFYFKKPSDLNHRQKDGVITKETINYPETVTHSNNNSENKNFTENKQPISEFKDTIKQQPILNDKLYKPNNIIFLVDVSSSMKDTTKLKVMQYALHELIEILRPSDKITFITYADSIKVLLDGIKGNEKTTLHLVVNNIKAKGMTKGKKAILFSLNVAIKNYIPNGNNQIILSTDGKFSFDTDDQKQYIEKKGNKLIKLTTIAFGKDKDAIKNLKEIAEIGEGNFIHIKHKEKAKEQLINEIKQNSLIK